MEKESQRSEASSGEAISKVTVQELDELIGQIAAKELEVEAHEAVGKSLNKALAELEGRAVSYMKELNRDSYESPHGKIKIEEKWRVNLPQTDLEKREFFDWLRSKGIFDKYATVNSNSLNSLYMAEWKEAQKRGEGMTFSIPGVPAPKLFEKPKFKAKKVES